MSVNLHIKALLDGGIDLNNTPVGGVPENETKENDNITEIMATNGTVIHGTGSPDIDTNDATIQNNLSFLGHVCHEIPASKIDSDETVAKVQKIILQNRELEDTFSSKKPVKKSSHRQRQKRGVELLSVQQRQRKDDDSILSNRYQCDVCEKRFKTKGILNNHQVLVHNKFSKYQCHRCLKYLPSAGHFKCHMTFHEGTKNYQCECCEKKFYMKSHLNDHIWSRTRGKPFTCELCEEQFSRRDTLKRHMIIHTDHKPYLCDVCGKEFARRSGLQTHIKKHAFLKS